MDHGKVIHSLVSASAHSKTSLSTAGREAGPGSGGAAPRQTRGRFRRARRIDSSSQAKLAPAARAPAGASARPAPRAAAARRRGGGLGAAGGLPANRAEARGGASRSSDEPFAAGSPRFSLTKRSGSRSPPRRVRGEPRERLRHLDLPSAELVQHVHLEDPSALPEVAFRASLVSKSSASETPFRDAARRRASRKQRPGVAHERALAARQRARSLVPLVPTVVVVLVARCHAGARLLHAVLAPEQRVQPAERGRRRPVAGKRRARPRARARADRAPGARALARPGTRQRGGARARRRARPRGAARRRPLAEPCSAATAFPRRPPRRS